MRTQKELNSKEFRDDMTPLVKLLKQENISHTWRIHPAATQAVKDFIGYYPTGENQILIDFRGSSFSVIRGMVSFGHYEIMKIRGRSRKFKDPERFDTPRELIDALKAGVKMKHENPR